MSRAEIWRYAGVLAVAGGMAMSTIVSSAQSVEAATNYQIGTFNMAGGHSKHKSAGAKAQNALVESIKNRKPKFLLLQEACKDWTEYIESQLDDYTVKFDPIQEYRSDPNPRSQSGPTAMCEEDCSEFGNAILYDNSFGINTVDPGRLLTIREEDLSREQREMLCARAEEKKIVVFNTPQY